MCVCGGGVSVVWCVVCVRACVCVRVCSVRPSNCLRTQGGI